MCELKDHLFDQWEQANIEVERLNCVNQELRDELFRLKTKYQATKVYEHSTTRHNSELFEELTELKEQLSSGKYRNETHILVPLEPTQRMLDAGHVVMNPIKGSLVQAGTNQKRKDCYKAMLNAYLRYGDESRVG